MGAKEHNRGDQDNTPGEEPTPSIDETMPGDSPGSAHPRKIGNYVIKRRIASGGMGTVYEAVQEHPRRPAALKVMRRSVASPSALRRFEYESQILARLRHPNIAQVYEAGTWDDGTDVVPFFAMEYIPNPKSITEYARAKKLHVRKRLELFATVCDAVHHGHQKGIVHRDLKPDNILVDSQGDPKVIDFGVARATDSDMAITAMQTEVGQLVGTLQYMSPEQTEADPHDIDIRSDVYTLGVILYELLTGKRPYDLGSAPVTEATRIIREADPAKPGAVDRALRGDIETIVLKALEKERERRYQSAASLAGDIRRYLNNEPIIARPPSLVYQLQVFGRRNRLLVGAAAAVVAALSAGVVVSTSLYLRAEKERARAEEETAKAISSLDYVIDLVKSTDPACVGEEVKVGELLDRYSAKIGGTFEGQPEIEAEVRTALAETYKYLDFYEYAGRADKYKRAAREHLTRALEIRRREFGGNDIRTMQSSLALADLLILQGDRAGAGKLLRHVWEICKKEYGPKDENTLYMARKVASNLERQGRSGEARPIAEGALEICESTLGEDSLGTIGAMRVLARILMDEGEYARAEELRFRALSLAEKNGFGESRLRDYRAGLADTYLAEGRIEMARDLYPNVVMPADVGILEWLQGEADLKSGEPTLLVRWEEWCPHSQRALPSIEELYEEYGDRGLRIVGLSRDSEEKTRTCLEARGLRYPNAMVDSTLAVQFGNTGVPEAYLFAGGRMVWRGHPDHLSRKMLDGLLVAAAGKS